MSLMHRHVHGENELRRMPQRYLVGLAARWHETAVALGVEARPRETSLQMARVRMDGSVEHRLVGR